MIRFYGARREYPAAGKDFIFENDVLITPVKIYLLSARNE
jgi:hypothetical protein